MADHLVDQDTLVELGRPGAEDMDVVSDVPILVQQVDDAATSAPHLHLPLEIRRDSLLLVIGRRASRASAPSPALRSGPACQPSRAVSAPVWARMLSGMHAISQTRVVHHGCDADPVPFVAIRAGYRASLEAELTETADRKIRRPESGCVDRGRDRSS